MNVRFLSLVTGVSLLSVTSAYALSTEKRDMKNNMSIKYKKVPKHVDTFSDMFSEGMLYGRLRSNAFLWDWKNEKAGKTKDNDSWGVGGSLIYKTGYLKGFGATAGFYTTHTIGTDNTDSAYPGKDFGKAGKDTYSRATGSGSHIDALAVAYAEYKQNKTSVKVGRQIFESTLLRSNDTKMIPNTFEGYSVDTKDFFSSRLRAAYFTKQKLRDHRTFHSNIAYSGWSENDDAGVHKGMTTANILAKGEEINPHMLVLTFENKTLIDNLKINVDYMNLDGFVSSIIPELNYKIPLTNGWSLTPGVRYFKQMDEGAGAVGGAALSGKLALDKNPTSNLGYKDRFNADGSFWAARLVLKNKVSAFSAGYSDISDDADIIAPWRGFPTGGYTRSMAQYNWEANTQSWMVKAYYDFGKANMVDGLRVALDYADMDYDDNKLRLGGLSKTDRNIVHLDAFKTFDALKNFELKFRVAFINADGNKFATDTTDYNSYNEYRLEANYFF